MSTTVRILILVGVLVISIISYFICIKLAKKTDGDNPKAKEDDSKIVVNTFYVGALIGAIILLFCYPNRVFLTIEKVEFISILLLVMDIVMIGTGIVTYGLKIKRNNNYMFIVIPILIIGLIIIFGFFEMESQKYIEETNKTVVSEKITPFITKQAKGIFVEYDDNNNVVSCKYYYIKDNNLADNEIAGDEIEDVVYLENNEDSYIEKTETSIDYINHEMKPSSDEYSYTKIEESYVLFLNKDQIVNVDN